MRGRRVFAFAAVVMAAAWGPARADESRQFPSNAAFSTLVKTPLAIEGLTGDDAGNLYTPGRNGAPFCPIWRVGLTSPTLVTVGNIPAPCSPSGLAFDGAGDLFVADGDRIYTFTPNAAAPPTATVFASGVPGANGVAFDREGALFVADTARGAIWKVELDRHGNLRSQTGCDTTFTANTLCLDNVFAAHPFLEGADGIALDRAGNIWVDANERNAVVVVTRDGRVLEVFRNDPDSVTRLRNTGPLEFPTSPFLLGKTFCTASSDGNRRDNSPNTPGEVNPAGPDRGKISCMDQDLAVQGLPLPVR